MDNKQKHLEFIQSSITRMADNSFLLKKWGVTVVSALLVLWFKENNINAVLISFMPILIFWILDGFYLRKERLFRSLYNKVRLLNIDEIDFNMNTDEFIGNKNTWIRSIFSKTLLIFYFTLVISILLLTFILNK